MIIVNKHRDYKKQTDNQSEVARTIGVNRKTIYNWRRKLKISNQPLLEIYNNWTLYFDETLYKP